MTTPLQQLLGYAAAAGQDQTAALRLIDAASDEAHGRWRPQVDSSWVVYRNLDLGEQAITVVNEQTGVVSRFRDRHGILPGADDAAGVAARYYAEHSRPDWLDAQRGDLWSLTIDGAEGSYLVVENSIGDLEFVTRGRACGLHNPDITDGELIYRAVNKVA